MCTACAGIIGTAIFKLKKSQTQERKNRKKHKEREEEKRRGEGKKLYINVAHKYAHTIVRRKKPSSRKVYIPKIEGGKVFSFSKRKTLHFDRAFLLLFAPPLPPVCKSALPLPPSQNAHYAAEKLERGKILCKCEKSRAFKQKKH